MRAERALGAALVAASAALAVGAFALAAPSLLPAPKPELPASSEAAQDGPATGAPSVDWAALESENPGVVGWVRVPGTGIDAPIAQAPADDPQMYLRTAFDGSESRGGCPYLDASCAARGLSSPLSLVYGHHLANGGMFSDFAKMSDPSYASEHPRILLLSPEGDRELEVSAVRVVDADEEPKPPAMGSEAEAASYLASERARAEVAGAEPGPAEKVWCFVTCSYQTDNSRTLVYAVDRTPSG